MPTLKNRKLTTRARTTRPSWTVPADDVARYNAEGWPVFRAGLSYTPDGVVSAQGKITNINAGGKYYVDASGTVQSAAASASYIHHIHNGTSWTPRGLLLEAARTNVLTDPFNISAAGWTPNGLNARSGPTTYAGMSFYKMEETTANTTHRVLQAWTFVNTTAAAKFYVRAGERTWCKLVVVASSSREAYINLSTGALGTLTNLTSAQVIVNKLADSVWEVSINGITGLTAGAGSIQVYNVTGDGASTTYAGTLGSGIYVGPVALADGVSEVGSIFSGTRTADTASISSAFLTPIKAAGKITIRYTPNAATGAMNRVLFDCMTGTDGFQLYIASGANAELSVNWNNTVRASGALTWVPGTNYDITLAWSGSTITLTRNLTVGYGPVAQAAGVSTINATAYLGQAAAGTLQANGAVALIEAVPA